MKVSWVYKFRDWFEERTGLLKSLAGFLHEEIPGGAKFSYTLGSACLFLLTIQVLSGIWQLFYYVPTIDYAYSSLNYLRLYVPYGWLVHGLHYWGGTLFTLVVGLHIMRVFIWGSYKKPREMVWLFGIVLILLTIGFMFTGPVLPWDKNGYWAGQVGIGIAGSVPVVGPFMQMLLQGADKMGQMALLRIYVLHVAIIPILIGTFATLHLVAFRRYGESGPWNKEERKKTGSFWPEQIFKDVLVAFLLFVLLVYLSAFFPAPFSGLADPVDTLITPKPAWPFLFLYQILKFFPGPLEPLGTAGVPLMIILLFASLPFIDRSEEKNPFKRGFVMACGFAFVAAIISLTWVGYVYRSPAEAAQMETAKAKVTSRQATAAAAVNMNQKITGKELFNTVGCTECHTVTGVVSNKIGPDLLIAKGNNRSYDWLYTQITSPETHNPRTIMPPFTNLSDNNIKLLIGFLEGLASPKTTAKASAKPQPASAPAQGQAGTKNAIAFGKQLVNTQGCLQCHTIQGFSSNKIGPDLIMAISQQKPDKAWLKVQLTNPQQHNPASMMPSYADRLKTNEMDAVIAYLSSLSTMKPSAPPAQGTQNETQQAVEPQKSMGSASASVNIIGNKDHGAVLFHQSCIMCHGPFGDTKSPGFAAPKGVPSLNPIDRDVFDPNAQAFIGHIDQFIQRGVPNTEGGPNMPDFGVSHALTQAQIADIESYVLSLNGVDRTKIINPGVEPKEFFYILLNTSLTLVCLIAVYAFILKFIKV